MKRFEHPIPAYLSAQKPKLSQKDFATRIEISDAYLSLIIDGRRRGPYELHKRIERETGGEITVDQMVAAYDRLQKQMERAS